MRLRKERNPPSSAAPSLKMSDNSSTPPRERYQVYTEYLKSGHWGNLKLRAMKVANHKCECCYNKTKLVGHHLIYRPILEDALVSDIMILCSGCHDFLHKYCKWNRIAHPATKKDTRVFLIENMKLSAFDLDEMRKDSRDLRKMEGREYRKLLKKFGNFHPSVKTYDMIIREITALRNAL